MTIKTAVAICTDSGILFYETKDRRLLQTACTRLWGADEALPDKPVVPLKRKTPKTTSNMTNQTIQSPVKQTRKPPSPLIESMVSFSMDLTSETQGFAGSEDGKLFVLQVRIVSASPGFPRDSHPFHDLLPQELVYNFRVEESTELSLLLV